MLISKKRINKIEKYFKNISKEKEVYISVPVNNENLRILKEKLGVDTYTIGLEIVPKKIGPVTRYNLNGKTIPLKDEPKETRTFEISYHVVDWQGNDHYGICYHERECYQRRYILPRLETIVFSEDRILSNLISRSDEDRLKLIVNIFLEIFGYCEVLDKDEISIGNDVKIKKLSWEILPKGEYPWNEIEDKIKKIINNSDNKYRKILNRRLDLMKENDFDFCAIGESGFYGYVVYAFNDIFVFESTEVNNATYVFKGDWKDASKLSKREIIRGELCYKRLIHNSKWENSILEIIGKS